jgi:hypothetical protein
MTVIELAPRLDQIAIDKAAALDAEILVSVDRLRHRYSDAMAKRIFLCIIECVQSNSEEPTKRLPPPIRQKLAAAFREEVQRIQPASVLPFSA